MKYTGINMSNVKAKNRSSLLYLLNNNGAMSRKDIAKSLGLTPASVTIICSELLEQGFIYEQGNDLTKSVRAGRKEVLLSLNLKPFYALSINIEVDKTQISIVQLDGRLILTKSFTTMTGIASKEHLIYIAKKAKKIMDESGISQKRFIGCGVGIIGSYNSKTSETCGDYGIWESGVRVVDILKQYIKIPITVENNVKAFAQAELIYGSGKKNNDMIFIKWGPGVGSSLVIDNKVYNANSISCAELGHYIIEPNGAQCRCGRRGCLELYVSSQTITNNIKSVYSLEKTPSLYKETRGDDKKINLSKMNLNKLYKDSCIEDILRNSIDKMASAVVNAATITFPGKVIVFGFMWNEKNFKLFTHKCKSLCKAYDENYIILSSLQDKVGFIGPAALVIKDFYFEVNR